MKLQQIFTDEEWRRLRERRDQIINNRAEMAKVLTPEQFAVICSIDDSILQLQQRH